jgi:hypothetical protein
MIEGVHAWAAAMVAVGCVVLSAAAWLLWMRALERQGPTTSAVVPVEDEQRSDLLNRDRIAALEARWLAVARHLTMMVVVLTVSMLVALIGIYSLFGRLQDSRIASLTDQCEQTNHEHLAIQQFVGDRNPDLTARTAEAFPIEPNCPAAARERAKVR